MSPKTVAFLIGFLVGAFLWPIVLGIVTGAGRKGKA